MIDEDAPFPTKGPLPLFSMLLDMHCFINIDQYIYNIKKKKKLFKYKYQVILTREERAIGLGRKLLGHIEAPPHGHVGLDHIFPQSREWWLGSGRGRGKGVVCITGHTNI